MPDPVTISIIEDNRFVRAGWVAVLDRVPDFEVLGEYGSCEQAFEAEELQDSDVILLDIGLPGMSGIEGVKHISQNFPGPAIVMCTVFDGDDNIFEAVCAGAIGYLQKKVSRKT